MAESEPVIGLDVGGSSIKHGLVDPAHPLDLAVRVTPINSQGTAGEIIGTLADIIAMHRAEGPQVNRVGFGFPGPFDYEAGISLITGLEKYEALYGLNIGEMLREKLDAPDLHIHFCNDAEAAIVGEANFGAGQPYSRIIGVTLGTGFGSAFVMDGRSVVSGEGVPANGWLYPIAFGNQRADDVFSTRGLLRRFAMSGISISTITEVNQTDVAVQAIFADFGADLGRFLRPFARQFRAECVIVMGGIAGAVHLFQSQLASELESESGNGLPWTAVKRGILGQRAAVLGAVQEWV